jgi:hypothetical protein
MTGFRIVARKDGGRLLLGGLGALKEATKFAFVGRNIWVL